MLHTMIIFLSPQQKKQRQLRTSLQQLKIIPDIMNQNFSILILLILMIQMYLMHPKQQPDQ